MFGGANEHYLNASPTLIFFSLLPYSVLSLNNYDGEDSFLGGIFIRTMLMGHEK